ncbi:MAG: HTH-type transcriptional repressor Bm3R1 [Syntrophorhabdus sp. PtaU1.Bin058]|nr:MAG: HTH-type transcriptional repressor Bm3R1 [Syntrophorhabdus sp. PtaU1.Bin058]
MNRRSAKDSKSSILDAALKAFSEHGYSGANMRTIAGNANISVGGLYLYFKSKEALCLSLMKERLEELSSKTERIVKDTYNPAEAIEKFISINLDYTKEHREIILTQGRDKGFTFGADVKKRFFRQQRKFVEKIIREGVRTGVFLECNVPETAKIVTAMLRGFVLSVLLEPDGLFNVRGCCEFVLRGLLKNV